MRRKTTIVCLTTVIALAACATSHAQAPPLGRDDSYWISRASQERAPGGARWFGSAEVLFFQRSRASRALTMMQGDFENSFPTVGLSTDQLVFDYAAGPRITFGRFGTPTSRLEVTYFGLFDWSEQRSIFDPDGISSGLRFELVGDEAHLRYASKLDSVEVNGRWLSLASPRWTGSLLTGFRYLRVQDQLQSLALDSGEVTEDVKVRTENDLIGWQLGGDLSWLATERLSLGGKAKGGLLLNMAQRNTDIYATETQSQGNLFRDQADFYDADLSGVIEFGLFGAYRVLPGLRLRGGYEVLCVTGVATAPAQYSIGSFLGGSELRDNGTIIYQGPTAGIEAVW